MSRCPSTGDRTSPTEKARSILGYNPQYSFDKMVETAVAYQRGDAINQIPN